MTLAPRDTPETLRAALADLDQLHPTSDRWRKRIAEVRTDLVRELEELEGAKQASLF